MGAIAATGYSVVIPPFYSWVRQGFLGLSGTLTYGQNSKAWHLADDRLYYSQPRIGVKFLTVCGKAIYVEPEERRPSVAVRFVAAVAEFPPGRTCSRCLDYRRKASRRYSES
jgi:hypothetical protein